MPSAGESLTNSLRLFVEGTKYSKEVASVCSAAMVFSGKVLEEANNSTDPMLYSRTAVFEGEMLTRTDKLLPRHFS